ncbi:MAG: calcium/sodium antiporter [Gemmataceae bacterium]|nr:calcium/sodium antiporter [Gemmataceae bacterium]
MILGVVLLVAGGEVLLRGAVGLATALRLTPAVIGMTVVAAGTSFPELAVSATAAYRGSPDLAVGNVVGSNIFNITVILGLAALIRTLPISGVTLKLEYPVLIIVTGLAILACRDGRVDAVEGVVFLAVYGVFMGVSVVLARRLNPAVAAEFQDEVEAMSLPGDQPRVIFNVLLLAAGFLLLSGGAQSTVYGATVLALQLGMSERVVGLTIVAIGTGLPEVVASVISAARGRGDVAVGNAIGSNMFNLLVVLGGTSLFTPVPVAPETAASDLWWMLGTTVIIFPLMVTRHKVGRWEGILLLIIYVSYMVTTLNSN